MSVNSPDDQAFLHCMDFMDFKILKRNGNRIVMSIIGEKREVKLIDTMPFDSHRRKQSVVVKVGAGKYMLFTKGADLAILPHISCSRKEKEEIVEKINQYAYEGHRTLVLACREMNQ
jgi:magnesium-transporting ATPase (P-type)